MNQIFCVMVCSSRKLVTRTFITPRRFFHQPTPWSGLEGNCHDGLTAVTFAMLSHVPDRPKEQGLRQLRHWAFAVPRVGGPEMPAEDRLVPAWVAKASRPLIDLHDPAVARGVLAALSLKRDGGSAAPDTVSRKRRILVNALYYAIEQGELGSNPLDRIR
jgi:hypothetical protein